MRRLSLNPDNDDIPSPKSRTILNQKMIDGFCGLILRGLPTDGVCDYLGIASITFWSWKQKGEKFLNGNGEPKEHTIYGRFIVAFRRAMAEYRLERLDSLHSDKKGKNWIKEMTILERRDRRSFSRHEPAGGTTEDFDPDEKFL